MYEQRMIDGGNAKILYLTSNKFCIIHPRDKVR